MQAFQEIMDMLDRKTKLNLKRAVFLPEWAYHGGKLNYNTYCATIASIGKTLTDFMVLNGLDKHPIGGNIALFEYFTNPSPLNDHKAYDYDFEDFRGQEDQTKTFVTKLMITHSGQCRSLPLLYKILANEIGAEAWIAYAPNHTFIRHKSEDGSRLMNIELTNKSMPREVFIIESMGITEAAIESGIYMKPCDDREILLDILAELASIYLDHVGMSHFLVEMSNKTLEYKPDHLRSLFVRNNMLVIELQRYQEHLKQSNQEPDQYLRTLVTELQEIDQLVAALGHIDMPQHLYDEWIESIQKEIERQKTNVSP